jgi:tRNA acetyltransferase TAN1
VHVDCVDFEQCAERFYGIKSGPEETGEEDESVDDIEASIKKEVASMEDAKGSTRLFSPVHLELECVLFFKTRSPIDPVDFVHRICKEIVSKSDIRRMRYANRLTPVSVIGRATEKGLEEVARTVLGAHFQLSGEERRAESGEEPQKVTPYSVSIIFILVVAKLDRTRRTVS